MISDNEVLKITNRKIAQCLNELNEVGYSMPSLAEQCVMKWFHYLSKEILIELSKNEETDVKKETNH